MTVHVSKCVQLSISGKMGFNERISIRMHTYSDRVTHSDAILTRNSFHKSEFLLYTIVDLHQLPKYTDVKILALGW